jgi:hypothetical protein
MRETTRPYVASIFRVFSPTEASLEASGAYVQLRNRTYLITNQHVAAALKTHSLAHQLADDEHGVRITNPFQALSYPVDIAISRIDDEIWRSYKNEKQALPVWRLAQEHKPMQHELLFLMGFSGERSYYSKSLEYVFSTATPYSTQESQLPQPFDPEVSFALLFSTGHAIAVDGKRRGLPNPAGFSGSLVWNTKAVESMVAGREWTPEQAQVTGIVWGWDTTNACLLATRVEHVRSFMLQALRQEAAYFRWLGRGAPMGDDLSDWFWAVRQIEALT